MSWELLQVIVLLLAAVVLFATGRVRMDVTALLLVVVFVLSGLLSLPEALVGFSDPNVILIAALFVVGEGLVRTGVAYSVGDWLLRAANQSETRMTTLLMLAVAGLGSVMSSTGVVAIFIPVALSIAHRMHIPPGRIMMPLSFAGLISGMMTLVAT
ncbi:MAG: SLC13 family permease, partial [Aeromonadaceae bacterium]|nr:SLC13 family permease [Aeromonadaceae bacterium]